MEMMQIAAIGFCAVLLAVLLKNYNGIYSTFIIFAACVLIFYFSVNRLSVILSAVKEIQSYIKINGVYLDTLVKIVGITYIAEFSCSLCKDAGYQAVAAQIEMFGKLSILAVSVPVLLALLKTIEGLVMGT